MFLYIPMPDNVKPKRGLAPLMLSQAAASNALVAARCVGCSRARFYEPSDLMLIFGDVPALNLNAMMRCEQCRETLSVKVTNPSASDRQKVGVRRIDRMWWVRRVSWREE